MKARTSKGSRPPLTPEVTKKPALEKSTTDAATLPGIQQETGIPSADFITDYFYMPLVIGTEEGRKRSRTEHNPSGVGQEQPTAKKPVLQKDMAKRAPGILIKEPGLTKNPATAEAVKAPGILLKEPGVTQAQPASSSARTSAAKSTEQPTQESSSQAATVVEQSPAAIATPRAEERHSATPASEKSSVVETGTMGGGEKSAAPGSKRTPPIVKEPRILMRNLRK